MNIHLRNRRGFILIAAFFLLVRPLAAAVSPAEDWNVAVLDKILAAVPPGQTLAPVGDMEIPVSYLQSWRTRLAGGPQLKIAFSGSLTAWTGGNVYYAFSNNVSAVKQKAFLDGAAEWAMFANLHRPESGRNGGHRQHLGRR